MPLGNPMGYFTGAGSMSGMGGFDPMMLQKLQAGMAGMGQNLGQAVQPPNTLGAMAQPPNTLGAAVQPGAFNMGGVSNNFGGGNSLGQAALDQNKNRGGFGGMRRPGGMY